MMRLRNKINSGETNIYLTVSPTETASHSVLKGLWKKQKLFLLVVIPSIPSFNQSPHLVLFYSFTSRLQGFQVILLLRLLSPRQFSNAQWKYVVKSCIRVCAERYHFPFNSVELSALMCTRYSCLLLLDPIGSQYIRAISFSLCIYLFLPTC